MQLKIGICAQNYSELVRQHYTVALQSSIVVKDMVEGGPDPWLFMATTEQE